MTRALPAAALLFAALVFPTTLGAKRADVPVATPAGAARDCVPIVQIRETHVRDDRTIDFEMDGGKVYRNTLPHDCPQLGFEQRFAYETSLLQLCSVDIITVFTTSPPMRGASCGLGTFQPVTLAPGR